MIDPDASDEQEGKKLEDEERERFVDEVVIVRSIASWSQGVEFVADRVRYQDAGRFHDVNRVVRVRTTEANRDEVQALGLARGDRVVISTNYGYTGDAAEMARTFNCGIGMVAILAEKQADDIMLSLARAGETVIRLGRIVERPAVAMLGT